jgi:hypothetical protein
MEFELPHLEDIYDFDEPELLRVKGEVTRLLATPEELTEKLLYKAQKIIELIDVELDERISVNQIAMFCVRELNSELYSEVSLPSRSLESMQTEVTTEAASASDEDAAWAQRRKGGKKAYAQFVRSTLSNTQECRGVIVGASSVKAKPPLKSKLKRAEDKTEDKPRVHRKPLNGPPKIEHKSSVPRAEDKPKAQLNQSTARTRVPAKRKTIVCLKRLICSDEPAFESFIEEAEHLPKPSLQGAEESGRSVQVEEEGNSLPFAEKSVKRTLQEEEAARESDVEVSGKLETSVPHTSATAQQQVSELGTFSRAAANARSQVSTDTTYRALEGMSSESSAALGKVVDDILGSAAELGRVDEDMPGSLVEPGDVVEGHSSSLAELGEVIEGSLAEHGDILESSLAEHGDIVDLSSEAEGELKLSAASLIPRDTCANSVLRADFSIEGPKQGLYSAESHFKAAVQSDQSQDEFNQSSDYTTNTGSKLQGTATGQLQPASLETRTPLQTPATSSLQSNPRPSKATQPMTSITQRQMPRSLPTPDSGKPDPALKDRPTAIHSALSKAAAQPVPMKEPVQAKPAPKEQPRVEQVLTRQPSSMSRSISSSSLKRPPPTSAKVRQSAVVPAANVLDYSHRFTSFGQIFAGFGHVKDFDLQLAMRDAILVFKDFDSLLSLPEMEFQRKFKLSLAPLEISPLDLIRNRQDISTMPELSDKEMYYRVVRARPEVYDIVSRSFAKLKGWSELPHGMNLRHSWNVMWTWSKPQVELSKLCVWQAVNHFPESKNFSRKDLLKVNIERIQKLSHKCQILWTIMPTTYCLPRESMQFIDHFAKLHDAPLNLWIMKPVGKSRGRGITVVSDITQVTYAEPMVIQLYISRPLLLGGFKFDMRIYVLITSFNPLEVFLYKQGFARLSTVPYSLNPDKLKNRYIHLTNYAVQKTNAYAQGDSNDLMYGGSKICLKTLRERLTKSGISFNDVWDQVREIVLKSLIACAGEIPSYKCCFDLVGYDIILDQDLRAWLLEVNSSPSLARDHFIDDLIKQQLIDDTLDIVDPTFFNKTHLVKVLQRRLAELQRGVISNSQGTLNADLTAILEGKQMRAFGDLPARLGNYERIAPSDLAEKLSRLAHRGKP